MAAAALHEGDVFAGRYRIVRELASGGMGAVYEVVHNVTERRCALKVMLAHTVEREQLRKRFMLESRLAAQIGSEYIVDVLDAGVDEATKAPYLVMELLEGEDLGQRLLRMGPLPREEAVSFLWHVALALDRTHAAGIVHRDLKASNLFLTRREDGSPLVKVLDFGVAKVLTLERSGSEQRTQTVGTPIYMAPEQFRAEGRISPATDIYALGMLSYTLLVGVHYWTTEHEKCENPFAFASIAVHGPKQEPSLRAAREGVLLPDEFDTWFVRATSRWPQDRFGSATEAITHLAHALQVDGALVPAPAAPFPSDALAIPLTSSMNALPATIESPSARLSSIPAPRTATPTAAPVALEPPGGEGPAEQHTEVSLTVTSGTGLPFSIEEQVPRHGHTAMVAAGVALATAIVAIALGRPWQSVTSHEAAKTPAARHSAAAPAETAAPAERRADKAKALDSLEMERGVTRIEELPLAPPEGAVEPRRAGEAPDRATAARTLHKQRAASPRRTPVSGDSRPGSSATEGSSGAAATPSDPARIDREQLYGRD